MERITTKEISKVGQYYKFLIFNFLVCTFVSFSSCSYIANRAECHYTRSLSYFSFAFTLHLSTLISAFYQVTINYIFNAIQSSKLVFSLHFHFMVKPLKMKFALQDRADMVLEERGQMLFYNLFSYCYVHACAFAHMNEKSILHSRYFSRRRVGRKIKVKPEVCLSEWWGFDVATTTTISQLK